MHWHCAVSMSETAALIQPQMMTALPACNGLNLQQAGCVLQQPKQELYSDLHQPLKLGIKQQELRLHYFILPFKGRQRTLQ